MNLVQWLAFLIWLACGALGPWLLRKRPFLGLDAGDAERKLQKQPVPLVGAIVLAGPPLLLLAAASVGALLVQCFGSSATSEPLGIDTESFNPMAPTGTSASLPLHLLQPLRDVAPVLLALPVAAFLGILDDRAPKGLKPAPKLLLQSLCGLLVGISVLSGLSGDPLPRLLGTLLLVVVLCNAWNFFDNFDGAVVWSALAGIAALECAPAYTLSTPNEYGWILVQNLGGFLDGSHWLPPALLGFLFWNWPRARAFLGDAGAHLLALLLLGHAIRCADLAHPMFPLETGEDHDFRVLLGALLATSLLPLLDMLHVTLVRVVQGIPPWRGDRRHLAHRLAKLLPAPAVGPTLGLLQFALGSAAVRLIGS